MQYSWFSSFFFLPVFFQPVAGSIWLQSFSNFLSGTPGFDGRDGLTGIATYSEQTCSLLSCLAFLWQDGVCQWKACRCGLPRANTAGGGVSVYNKANCLERINKYSKVFFCLFFSVGNSTPGGPVVPIVRGRGIGEEIGFSLFFALKLSLKSEPPYSHISIPQWPDLS